MQTGTHGSYWTEQLYMCGICGEWHTGLHDCDPAHSYYWGDVTGTSTRQPWTCPKCGQVNGPYTERCNCVPPKVTNG